MDTPVLPALESPDSAKAFAPLHDALTVAFVAHPELFQTKRYRVDVELGSPLTVGETVADIYQYRKCDDSWGPTGKNCSVAIELDVSVLCLRL